MLRRFWVILLFTAGVVCAYRYARAGEPTTVLEAFARLRAKARAAREAGDKQARLQVVLEIEKLLNGAPDAVEAAAEAYADAGDSERAIAALRQFASLGQADDSVLLGKTKRFASLLNHPQYQSILKRFAENQTAVSRAEKALDMSDAGLLAEDIDYDPISKSFLVTSVLEKKIVHVGWDGKTTDFAESPSHWPMLAIKVDANHSLVWATEVALDGFSAAPKPDWGRSAVLCFDLATGKLRHRIEGPPHSGLGDMVLTREGDPIVSDGQGGGVYRVSGESLRRIDGGDFISPQTPAMHPDGKHLFVPDYVRGVGVLDLGGGHPTWLSQDEHATSGIDGLYFEGGALIATQNGSSPERVIRFELNPKASGIVAEEIIERATPTLGDPTHGVIVEGFFYYIANSGWSEVDDHGDLKAGAKLTPAHIMRFRMPQSHG